MCSEKRMSADNQQERLDANWIVGFVDGEGCFHVGINLMPKMQIKYQEHLESSETIRQTQEIVKIESDLLSDKKMQ